MKPMANRSSFPHGVRLLALASVLGLAACGGDGGSPTDGGAGNPGGRGGRGGRGGAGATTGGGGMAGGAGTRLWPVSRGDKPKQLISVVRDNTQALSRLTTTHEQLLRQMETNNGRT